jgi:hypothetical protein
MVPIDMVALIQQATVLLEIIFTPKLEDLLVEFHIPCMESVQK